jgi:lipopolysaccharide biosynthesis regulator YciM
MSDGLLYIVILFTLAVGFLLGRHRKEDKLPDIDSLDKNYFEGLNYLLNEQPDKAIDTFIQALEVNSDTLETHLALGRLLRKRGEVDRAVRIHQNLLAHPSLNSQQMQQAQYELAIDYVKSGLLDRAEELLQLLVKNDGPYKQSGLKQLLEIYQDEKEWLLGLEVLQQLSGARLSRDSEKWAAIRAHFSCELAEEALEKDDFVVARQHLKQALAVDKQSVRSSILLGRIEIHTGDTVNGISRLQKVIDLRHDYIVEVLPYILSSYRKVNKQKECLEYLLSLNEKAHHPDVLISAADLIEVEKGALSAAEFVAAEVVRSPTSLGLLKLLDYYSSFSEGKTHEHLVSLKYVMNKVVVSQPLYQCYHCGFKANNLFWLCPSCKSWDGLRLVSDMTVG